jgi:hypothetical protein
MKGLGTFDLVFEAGVTSIRPVSLCVVRLTTTSWSDRRGLLWLRRLSKGFNVMEEDADCVGADLTVARILNIDECADGVYRVVTCNESLDFETGYVDDYDYRLVPFDAKEPT